MVLKILHRFVCLYFVVFNFSVAAQLSNKPVEAVETLNPSLPLKLCFQDLNDKILSIDNASDNVLVTADNNSINSATNTSAIMVALQGGKIEKLNLTTNLTNWISELGGEIVSGLITDGEKVYLVTKVLESKYDEESKEDYNKSRNPGNNENQNRAANYILWAVNVETGITVWQFPFTSDSPVALDAHLDKVLLTKESGTIVSVSKIDGQKVSERNLSQQISSKPAFFKNKIYIGTRGNSILAFSSENGQIISSIPVSQSPATVLAVAENRLYWGEEKGIVNIYDISKSTRLRTTRYGGEISSLMVTPGGLLAASLDNFVYFLSTRTGKNIWKRRLAGRTLGKPLQVGSFAVFIIAGDDKAVVLDLRNGKIVNLISLSGRGFVLSMPLIVGNLLVFSTNQGIFAFAGANANCSEKWKKG